MGGELGQHPARSLKSAIPSTVQNREDCPKLHCSVTHTSFVEQGPVVCKNILIRGELIWLVIGVLAVARGHGGTSRG